MKKPFLAEEVRKEFPILNRKNRGFSIAYLDNAASSQKPTQVIDSISDYYRNFNSNIHRGIYELAEQAESMYSSSRQHIADYLSVKFEEIIFVRGATEGLNLIAHTLGSRLKTGDVVILSEMEHHANIVPWQLICKQIGATIEVIPTLPEGNLDMEVLEKLLRSERSKILSINTHFSPGLAEGMAC